MKYISDYSFEDGKMLSIYISTNFAEVVFEQWNGKQIKLYFEEYWRIKDKHSAGEVIGELLIKSSGETINEIIKDITDGGGSTDEAIGLSSYSFVNSWGDRVLLEIVALNVRVEE